MGFVPLTEAPDLTTPTVLAMAGLLAVSPHSSWTSWESELELACPMGRPSTACRADRRDPETIPRWRRQS
jgi:hypothetical protein